MPESDEPGHVQYSGFGFKTIWVLESWGDAEQHTGTKLYDDVLLPLQHEMRLRGDSQYSGFRVEPIDVANRVSLFESLEKIRCTLYSTRQVPLIHFETHGSKEGFHLKSGEDVRYEELCPILREINILAQNKLFIVVAACEGAYLAKILQGSLTEPCPFREVLGPSVQINGIDIIDGYAAFYKELLTSFDMNAAFDSLKKAIPDRAGEYHIWNSEYLFLCAFKCYLQDYCTSEAIDQKTQAILNRVLESDGDALDAKSYECSIREQIRSENAAKQVFDRMKVTFFMHDRYPDNVHLPNPDFDKMKTLRVPEIG